MEKISLRLDLSQLGLKSKFIAILRHFRIARLPPPPTPSGALGEQSMTPQQGHARWSQWEKTLTANG